MLREKARTFIKRDFIIETSYKLNFILTFLNSSFPVISFFFVSKLVQPGTMNFLDKYNGGYFSFVLIGIAFTRFFQLAVDTFSDNIKRAQMAGCLEAILSSQTKSEIVVLFSSFYSFISAGVQLIFIFTIGTAFLGFSFGSINILSTIIVLFPALIIFISIGILSASGTIIFKQGEPIGWLFGALSAVISGAVFPISVMPHWLQLVSKIFPTTYVLEALRLSVLANASVSSIGSKVWVLLCIAAVLFPLSLRVFKWAVEKGKKDGTLIQY